jgi:hypothetical protein
MIDWKVAWFDAFDDGEAVAARSATWFESVDITAALNVIAGVSLPSNSLRASLILVSMTKSPDTLLDGGAIDREGLAKNVPTSGIGEPPR